LPALAGDSFTNPKPSDESEACKSLADSWRFNDLAVGKAGRIHVKFSVKKKILLRNALFIWGLPGKSKVEVNLRAAARRRESA